MNQKFSSQKNSFALAKNLLFVFVKVEGIRRNNKSFSSVCANRFVLDSKKFIFFRIENIFRNGETPSVSDYFELIKLSGEVNKPCIQGLQYDLFQMPLTVGTCTGWNEALIVLF